LAICRTDKRPGLISAGAAVWALLASSTCAAWLSAAAACGLIIGAFTPIGFALTIPLENRFPFSPLGPQVLILLAGGGRAAIDAASTLSRDYPKASLTFCGFSAANEDLIKRFGDLGGYMARIHMEPRPRTTAEDALYSGVLLKPEPGKSWLLVTAAMHMPRAVGCFRIAGFRVAPYPVEFMTRGRSGPFAAFATGSSALSLFDRAAKEWIGLLAYRLMSKTDALFPGP